MAMKVLYHTVIAGRAHHMLTKGHTVAKMDPVSLVREPENVHDSNAIAVFHEKVRIGYVPRGPNNILSKLIELGFVLDGIVSHDKIPDERIVIRVEVPDER